MGSSIFPAAASSGAVYKQTFTSSGATSFTNNTAPVYALVVGGGGGTGGRGGNYPGVPGGSGGTGGIVFGLTPVPTNVTVGGAGGDGSNDTNNYNNGNGGNAGGSSQFGMLFANGGGGGGGAVVNNPGSTGSSGTPTIGSYPSFVPFSIGNVGKASNSGAVYVFY
jgi:hypothetical protein